MCDFVGMIMDSLGEILYLSRVDIERLGISIKEIIRIVEEAFREKAAGRTEAPPKPGIHPEKDAFIHAMPAYLEATKAAGIKWVAGYPENPNRNLPYISGLLILNDAKTGLPIAIMDCSWVTAKRTGAATAVAAKHLAREDSRGLGILGCGTQGRSNLEALMVACTSLEQVKAYDTSAENLQEYVKQMTVLHGISIIPVESPKKAVKDCDIVVTSGPILKKPQPIIEKSWFRDGGLACPLDFDSYWKSETMHSMNKFCTDDRSQLAYYKAQGYFADVPEVYADLGEIVSGAMPGRESRKERIMAMNLGLAIEDIATASYVYKEAKKARLGTILPL
jgi:ornithine cyclodeaminase/alanine dehydrogenase-like protein (mu-crystallin family)